MLTRARTGKHRRRSVIPRSAGSPRRAIAHRSIAPRSGNLRCGPWEEFPPASTCGCFRSRWFRPQEIDGKLGGGNMHGLAAHGPQMHLNAASFVIDSGDVLKLCEIEVGIEFAIDASQQIQVEGRGHSQFVVVGRQQLSGGFLQIGSEQKRVAGLKNAANFGKKSECRRGDRSSRSCFPGTARGDAGRSSGAQPLRAAHQDIRARSPEC